MTAKKLAGYLIAMNTIQIAGMLNNFEADGIPITIGKNPNAKIKKLLDIGYGVIVYTDEAPRLTVYLQVGYDRS